MCGAGGGGGLALPRAAPARGPLQSRGSEVKTWAVVENAVQPARGIVRPGAQRRRAIAGRLGGEALPVPGWAVFARGDAARIRRGPSWGLLACGSAGRAGGRTRGEGIAVLGQVSA